jgi:hypothetical protein
MLLDPFGASWNPLQSSRRCTSRNRRKHLSDFELKAIVQLWAYYGNNLEMMSVDRRRNPLQWSIPQLKRVMAIYEREAVLLATIRDERERTMTMRLRCKQIYIDRDFG